MHRMATIRWQKALTIFILFLSVIFAYTVVHELGHALAGLAFGGRVTWFNVSFFNLDAAVGLWGEFSAPQHAVISAAGVGLTLLVALAVLLLVPRRTGWFLQMLKLFTTTGVLGTLLVWILFPVLVFFGTVPGHDDSINFLNHSGFHPLAVSLAAVLFFAAGIWLYRRRSDPERGTLASLRDSNALSPADRRSLTVVTVVLAAGLVTSLLAGGFSAKVSGVSSTPPEGYRLAAKVDLSAGELAAEPVAGFRLDQPARGGVYLLATSIDAAFLDLSLEGPQGFSQSLLHGEGFTADEQMASFEEPLPAGDYQVVVTSQSDSGVLKIYVTP